MNRAAQYQQLRQQNGELAQTVQRQEQRIEELEQQVLRLEAQLAAATKSSVNSSKPPSSDLVKPKGSGKRGARKIGGQPGHARHERPAFTPEQIDQRKLYGLDACPDCGSRDLDPLPEPGRVVQQAELVLKPFVVTEHVAQKCRCLKCHAVHEAKLPEAVTRTGLIGSRFLALLLFVKGALHVSYSGLQELLDQALGLRVCRGFLAKVMTHKGVAALAAPVEELRGLLPTQTHLNVDETSHRENKQLMWTWCFRARTFVVFSIQTSRGTRVLIDLLGVEFAGVLGCDYFSSYRKFMGLMNGTIQFCLAHLIRDLKFLAEHPDAATQRYAQPLLKAVGRLFALIHQQVERPELDFQKRLERQKRRMIQWATDTSVISPIPWYVSKHCPQVANMAQRFRKHGEAYFTFLTTPEIAPTNNLAEQAIRFVVIDRHVTQGTRGPVGRIFCESIWTIIGTCRLQGRSIFQFLCQAVDAWSNDRTPPSLVPVLSIDSS